MKAGSGRFRHIQLRRDFPRTLGFQREPQGRAEGLVGGHVADEGHLAVGALNGDGRARKVFGDDVFAPDDGDDARVADRFRQVGEFFPEYGARVLKFGPEFDGSQFPVGKLGW